LATLSPNGQQCTRGAGKVIGSEQTIPAKDYDISQVT